MSFHSLLDDLHKEVSRRPQDPRAHFELGAAAQQHGNFELAEECFIAVTRLAESVAAGHFNLGNARFSQRKYTLAAVDFARAAKLECDRSTLNNLGNALAACGKFEESLPHFRRALELPNDGTEANRVLRNLGLALEGAGDWQQAAQTLRTASEDAAEHRLHFLIPLVRVLLKHVPLEAMELLAENEVLIEQSCDLLVLLAQYLVEENSFSQALAKLMRANELSPDHPAVLRGIGLLNLQLGKHFESLVCLHRALSQWSFDHQLHSAWLRSLLLQNDLDLVRYRSEAVRWRNAMQTATTSDTPTTGSQVESAPLAAGDTASYAGSGTALDRTQLRLGFVLGATPPDAFFLQPLLLNAATLNYQVVCYSDLRHSELSQAIAPLQLANVCWRSTRHLRDAALSSLILQDQIDLLVDCWGHEEYHRLAVFSQRSAQVQMSWGAWRATTGITEMDCLLADEDAVPAEDAELFVEQIVRHPTTLYPFATSTGTVQTSRIAMQETNPNRADAILGSICPPSLILESTLNLWTRVLNKLPGSKLRLADAAYSDATACRVVQERFLLHGIQVERLDLVAATSPHTFLSGVQVVLDPSPINAPEQAAQCLLHGIPVVALRGSSLRARVTASLLKGIGLQAWCADNTEGYSRCVEDLLDNRKEATDHLDRALQASQTNHTAWCREFLALVEPFFVSHVSSKIQPHA